jgi:hypothetical protein
VKQIGACSKLLGVKAPKNMLNHTTSVHRLGERKTDTYTYTDTYITWIRVFLGAGEKLDACNVTNRIDYHFVFPVVLL